MSPLEYRNDYNHIAIPHDNLPPYKEVYIWQCVELTDEEKELEKPLCNVTFDGNGGIPSQEIVHIHQGEKLGRIPTPSRIGYSLSEPKYKDGTGTSPNENTTINNDITYYAQWEIKTFTINFHYIGED